MGDDSNKEQRGTVGGCDDADLPSCLTVGVVLGSDDDLLGLFVKRCYAGNDGGVTDRTIKSARE